MWTTRNTELATWFERDRQYVELTGEGRSLAQWWDDAVTEAIEDGFLEPRDLHRSAVAYVNSLTD